MAGGKQARFWHLRQVLAHEPSDECWIWPGYIGRRGYGQVYDRGRRLRAHRVVYEAFMGPIPDGLVLDHLCRNTSCVNPTHLEPVTDRENLHRGPTTWASVNSQKTHCPSGHPYSGENLYLAPSGRRVCKTCQRRAALTYWRRTFVLKREEDES